MFSKKLNPTALKTTRLKHWYGTILTYLLIPKVLMICGGDFGWWQGWLYGVLIVLAGICPRVLAEMKHPGFLAERMKFGKDQHVKLWDKILAPLMAMSFSFLLVIVAGLDHRFGWSPELPIELNILGFIFIVIGYAFAGWALVENQFFSTLVRIQKDRGHQVCETGPYQFVRHPGYAGNLLAVFGIVLAFSSLWTIVPGIVALIITFIRTALEDRTLQEELPGYRDYTQKVSYRLIPGVY